MRKVRPVRAWSWRTRPSRCLQSNCWPTRRLSGPARLAGGSKMHSQPGKAFPNCCAENLGQWKEDPAAGRNGAKVNASQLFAHQVVEG